MTNTNPTDASGESELAKILDEILPAIWDAGHRHKHLTCNMITLPKQINDAKLYVLNLHNQQIQAKTKEAEDRVLDLANKFCGACEDSYLTPIRTADGNITYFCLSCDGIPAMTTPNVLSKPYVNNKVYTRAELQAKVAEAQIKELGAVVSIFKLPFHQQVVAFQQVKDRLAHLAANNKKKK